WMDRRFVFEHMAHLSREAVLLYFFLAAVADKHGLSFYADGTLATLLRMTLPALIQAREELLAHDLIAHEVRFTQVLSLLPPCQPGLAFRQHPGRARGPDRRSACQVSRPLGGTHPRGDCPRPRRLYRQCQRRPPLPAEDPSRARACLPGSPLRAGSGDASRL